MTQIIALLGPAGSGKSTVSKHLVERYGARVYTLAAPLKVVVGRAFDLTDDQLYGTQKSKETVDPRYNVSPRWLFQRIGTEGIRAAFGEDVWWELLLKKVKEDQPFLAVNDDCRFVNEAEGLRSAGAKIIRLESATVKVTSTHASETEWMQAPYDVIVQHDGKNLSTLLDPIDKLCYELGITPTNILG